MVPAVEDAAGAGSAGGSAAAAAAEVIDAGEPSEHTVAGGPPAHHTPGAAGDSCRDWDPACLGASASAASAASVGGQRMSSAVQRQTASRCHH